MQPTIQTLRFVRLVAFIVALAAAACGDGNRILTPSPGLLPQPAVPAATFTVSGVIVESTEAGLVAVEGATVENSATHDFTVTDSEGAYAMAGLNPGLAQLSISKEGFEAQIVEMMIDGDERIDVTLVRQ